jgi:hypothetical protein
MRMPTLTVQKTRGRQSREVDFDAILRVLTKLRLQFDGDVFVMTETPQMRPAVFRDPETNEVRVNQGVSSQVKFMGQWHELRGMLRALKIPHDTVHPATWKADVFRGTGERGKDAARMRAAQIYPQLAGKFKTKNSADLAEALLIADYARIRRSAPF